MVPQYIEASASSPVTEWQDSRGESWVNVDGESDPTHYAHKAWLTETHVSGFFYRLSAPGYTDCTDWSGPFATLAEAQADCERTFDCDPKTGDDLDEVSA